MSSQRKVPSGPAHYAARADFSEAGAAFREVGRKMGMEKGGAAAAASPAQPCLFGASYLAAPCTFFPSFRLQGEGMFRSDGHDQNPRSDAPPRPSASRPSIPRPILPLHPSGW